MFAALWASSSDDYAGVLPVAQFDEQSPGGTAPGKQSSSQVEQPATVDAQAPRALWDEGRGADSGRGQKAAQREEERRQRAYEGALATIGEAYQYCDNLIAQQLQSAARQKPAMNTAINGDAAAKRAIFTLLPDAMIRKLFLETSSNTNAWPRLRPLFGAPPYNFLGREEAGLMRAAGLSTSRTNMAYSGVEAAIANYSQFGSEHLVDSFAREYRVMPSRTPMPTDTLPCDIESAQHTVVLNVRVPKRSREQRTELLRDRQKQRSLTFPYVGETLEVRYSNALRKVWGARARPDHRTRLLVKSMTLRSASGNTASLVGIKV